MATATEATPPPAAAPSVPARPSREKVASSKRKEAEAASAPDPAPVAAKAATTKCSKKTDKEKADKEKEITTEIPEGGEEEEATKKKVKERDSKEKACPWLHAEQTANQPTRLQERNSFEMTEKITLSVVGKKGGAAKTQIIVPGDVIQAWTSDAKCRKLDYVIYRLQKGVNATYWQMHCRHADEARLTKISIADITNIRPSNPNETVDERRVFLKDLDARELAIMQGKQEEDEQKARSKKKLKKLAATSSREPPTPGNVLRPSDFASAHKAMLDLMEKMKEEREAERLEIKAYLAELNKARADLDKETQRLEKVREDLTRYGMNRSMTVPHSPR